MASPHSAPSNMVFGEADSNVSHPSRDRFPGCLPVTLVNCRTCLGQGGFDPFLEVVLFMNFWGQVAAAQVQHRRDIELMK